MMKICYSIIIVVFIVLLFLSLQKKKIKKDTFTYSSQPIDDGDGSSNVNPDLFIQKARISNNEVVVCKTVNGQYQCKIKRKPCT